MFLRATASHATVSWNDNVNGKMAYDVFLPEILKSWGFSVSLNSTLILSAGFDVGVAVKKNGFA